MLLKLLKSAFSRHNGATDQPEPLTERVRHLFKEKRFTEAKQLLRPQSPSELADPDALALLAEAEFHLGNDDEADNLAVQVLRQKPYHAQAHYVLSMINLESGNFEEALAQAQFADRCQPHDAYILGQVGLCHIKLEQYQRAAKVLTQAVNTGTLSAALLTNLGIALHAMGELNEAVASFAKAIETEPAYAPAQANLEICFPELTDYLLGTNQHSLLKYQPDNSLGNFRIEVDTDAPPASPNITLPGLFDSSFADELEDRLRNDPHDSEAACDLARFYMRSHKPIEARDILTLSISNAPENVSLRVILGELEHNSGKLTKAREHYEYALRLEPDNLSALSGLARVSSELEDFSTALIHIQHAVDIAPSATTLAHLAAIQTNACQYEQALATIDRAIKEYPFLQQPLQTILGACHAYLGNFSEAENHLSAAKQTPSGALPNDFFSATIELLHENYPDGWEHYKARFIAETKQRRLLPQQWWNGERLDGKSILLLAEQGLGDQVMFASCIKDLLGLNPAKVILEVEPRLVKTLTRSFPEVHVIPAEHKTLESTIQAECPDFYTPIGDLPRHFRRSLASFPDHDGYLVADPQRVCYWRDVLRARGTKPNIGITWRGGTQKTRRPARSFELEALLPILNSRDIQFVNLQYGDTSKEVAEFCTKTGIDLLHRPEAIADLDEFAALISALDLVITVCNTTVHFAGALNKPVWVMAPMVPEWRYGLTTERLRWYPSSRIFRQQRLGDWQTVMRDLDAALKAWLPAQTQASKLA